MSRWPVVLAVLGLVLALCSQASASSKNEWRLGEASLGESVAVAAKGKITISDSKAPIIGAIKVECEGSTEGHQPQSATSEITSFTLSGCVNLKGCPNPSAVAAHLPWHPVLSEEAGSLRDVTEGGGSGPPDYQVKCKGLIGEPQDECSGRARPTLTNGTAGVSAKFDPTEKLESFITKENTCSLEGTQTIEASKGGKLSAVTAAEVTKLSEAEWILGKSGLTEPWATTWAGNVKLSIGSLGIVGECKSTGKGPITPVRTGEVTTFTLSACTNVKSCSKPTMEATNLPWHTELVTIEGVIREVLVGGGKGTPGLTMTCEAFGTTVKDECTGALSTTATNGTKVVLATFRPSEALHCSIGTTLEGAQTIAATELKELQVR